MKKLRMIVTSVIVLAIVGSAFSFKVKSGSFCVLAGATSGNCTTFKRNVNITTDTQFAQYMYYPCWDQSATSCTTANNGLCTVGPVRLGTDND